MSDFVQDLRHSVRLLLKNPGFSLTAILVLALGIAANAAVFTLVNTLMFKPLAGSERPGQVVGIYSHDHTRPDSYRGFSYPGYTDIRDNATSFSHVTAFTLSFVGIGEGDATRRTFAAVVARNYFQTLGVDLLAGPHVLGGRRASGQQGGRGGRELPLLQEPRRRPVAARQDGQGELAAVHHRRHRPARLHGHVGARRAGGLGAARRERAGRERLHARRAPPRQSLADRRNQALMLVGRLKPGLTRRRGRPGAEVALRPARAGLSGREQEPAAHRARRCRACRSRPNPQNGDEFGATFGMLMGMAAIVLVVACLNLANMMLARGTARRKEIAMRLALGGGRAPDRPPAAHRGARCCRCWAALFGLLLGYWGVERAGRDAAAALARAARVRHHPRRARDGRDAGVLRVQHGRLRPRARRGSCRAPTWCPN